MSRARRSRADQNVCLGRCAHLRKGHKTLGIFIPQVQAHASKALADGHAVDVGQLPVVTQDFWQPVERDAALEVMHVVDTDVGTKPL